MRSSRFLAPVTVIIFACLVAACDQSNPTPTVVNSRPLLRWRRAAKLLSLRHRRSRDVFGQIKTTAEASDLSKVTYNFAGSQALVPSSRRVLKPTFSRQPMKKR